MTHAHPLRWWTLGATSCAAFLFMLDSTVVNLALPELGADLGAPAGQLTWVLNAYTLTLASLLVLAGSLGDRVGLRVAFLSGVTLFGMASLAAGATSGLAWLVVARIAQGAGAALMMPAALALVADAFAPEERGRAIGIWVGASSLGLILGPVAGAAAVDALSWRVVFLVNGPLAAAVVAVMLLAAGDTRAQRSPRRPLDLTGTALIAAALAMLMCGLQQGVAWGWGSVGVLSLLLGSGLAFAAFVAVERRAPAPIADRTAFGSTPFVGTLVVALLLSFLMFAGIFLQGLYLQDARGLSPSAAGLRMVPCMAALVLLGGPTGRLTDRIGPRTPIVAGMLVCGAATSWLAGLDRATGDAALMIGLAILGVGIALVQTPMMTVATRTVPSAGLGSASGILASMRMLGATAGVTCAGVFLEASGGSAIPALRSVFPLSSGLAIIGAAVALKLLPAARPGKLTMINRAESEPGSPGSVSSP
jgi:EmrB/QacA subfamily drug resistance transporter